MAVFFEAPFLIYLYLLHYFLYQSHLINLDPKITILLIPVLLFFLPLYLRAPLLTEMLVLL
jgi:hypothetical protein